MGFYEFIKGKSVAVVGGAEYVETPGDVDVIVSANRLKLNGLTPHCVYHSGRRLWDEIHSCTRLPHVISYNRTEFFDGAKLVYAFHEIYEHSNPRGRVKSLRLGEHWLQQFKKGWELGHPLTGFVAILDLLRHPIRSMHVTGMDFYGVNFTERELVAIGGHNLTGHQKLLKSLVLKDFLTVDNRLSEILEQEFEGE